MGHMATTKELWIWMVPFAAGWMWEQGLFFHHNSGGAIKI